ncbi:uncharacterized protein Z520_03459 [Fonsecaea multimorphosa CBS 102226]|uniref:Cyclin-D1-binding protein 1-like N-terminal domain-containing protein n=1 Tax=Fonsecaea multimorphosa CBS 102226 TaxID=1442371 RepID=A0A0D2K4Q9_9EURO|nr:uncharacterized protein Z520_03459 [Fonsecaea multimorphosa CBS 102226]KIY00793.1 hypothetical protein Z520_03459 [Fonsecaea multimorphosa CBS 102226]OAL27892.1 hypothetical protein AYO22_03237 [Fonsecaea multimorphosa]
MSSARPVSLSAALQTSIVLCQRFAASLAPNSPVEVPQSESTAPSPLVLLHAAATTLRAQVTKLSLLAITAPFTPSAATTCLLPLNESILTSLVTAALLTTPDKTIPAFSAECRNLAATALRDMQTFLRLLEARSQTENHTTELDEREKAGFTEATGKVWDDCDKLLPLAADGVTGYVVRKSKQWLDLMKDAVKELQDWDPEDDIDEHDPFGINHSDHEDSDNPNENEHNNDRAAISAGVKEQALKVLNRIPQSIHVVIKQRLERMPTDTANTAGQMCQMDTLLKRIRHISELIDESAEGMYLGDLELCLKKAGEARALTIEVVESVLRPISEMNATTAAPVETNEDRYVQRALEWIRQVDPGVSSRKPT